MNNIPDDLIRDISENALEDTEDTLEDVEYIDEANNAQSSNNGVQKKINISTEDLKRYNHHAANVSKVSFLAPIDLVLSFLRELNNGVNVPLLYKSAIFSCLLESTLSLVFKVPQVGLYYCIGVSLFCVFVYITNPTEHHVKTWQSAKLYFNAGILIDSINQIGVKIKNIYLRLIRYFNIHKQQDEDSTEDVVD